MSDNRYDVIVIGSGPGGYVAAIRCGQLGLKTACVEKNPTLGGTCLNVGCIPSKALLQTSEHFTFIRTHASDHGITCVDASFDWGKIQQRKDQVVSSLVNGIPSLLKNNKVDRIDGAATFKGPGVIQVGDKTYEARTFIIATGSEAVPLPFLPFDEKVIVSSTGALSLPQVPKKMLVIGAGVIGVELASVYARLGTDVTIVEMLDRVTPAMDQAVSRALLQVLKKQGIKFHLGAKVVSGKVEGNRALVKVIIEGNETEFDVDVVMVAVGRRPFTGSLGLDTVSIKTDSKGFIPVNDHFETSVKGIYAIGDVVDGAMLAHRAMEEGVAVAEIIAGQNPHINYLSIPNVIYTNPEVAAVGLTEAEARDASLDIFVGTSFFKGNARARCAGETDGFVKIIGDKRTGRLIGMHIIGPHASEMIGEGVISLESKMTVEDVANSSHAHPTLSEAIKEACLQALGRPIHA